ncbi:hypothetical protein Mal4_03270 [Maioricimonas rarisocia]|uniref:Cytochrome C n=1 Tax=Maioricimonas rarisocia TaxID=2528026 RepID=A0A517Z0N6_9PLAN|nr:hypothetical protein [Maioricimonas rarisocia]QDU36044.1 hypothetical protein Mal4_03270 [Maioricimonas rarisocia]
MTRAQFRYGVLLSAGLVAAWGAMTADGRFSAEAADDAAGGAAVEPVEDDMHEFMEYVFQPTFKRLKPAMASEPENNAGWKTIKSDALILAEGGNLLLSRAPEDKDEADAWAKLSVAVRKSGGELYAAAKKREYKGARGAYETMIRHCNACHDEFAGGEYQLSP